ncbi:NDR1/HIN1-like protein 1 [Bienertia sinuspersici]
MMHTKSGSDVTSLAPSSPPKSPKRPIYYVQSPSRESQDGDKAHSLQATPMCNSPMESPLHPNMGRHSRNSSSSRFSGVFRSSSDRKASQRRNENEKGWPECKVILEEGNYDDINEKGLSRRIQVLIGLLSFVVLFTLFCLIIWGASRPFKTQSLAVHNFYVSEATDFSGVPTKVMTFNGSLKLSIHNPATFFGIHVSSTPITLLYSKIAVATGQKHYQPRKSHRTISITVEGDKVPLYGAGSSIEVSSERSGQVPFMLAMEIRSRGDVVGKLVRTSHRLHAFCNVTVDYLSTKPIKFRKNTCSYE